MQDNPTVNKTNVEVLRPSADERSRLLQVANNAILHLHPATVPAAAVRFTYTWGLGGMAALLGAMLGLTGVLLMFRYDARVDYAYMSIQSLETEVMFGSLVRALHHWSANLLVIVAVLHLARVFFTGSYKQGRTVNWVIGVALLILALASNFTGYLLPWDQLAYWAITVSTSLLAYIPLVGTGIRNFALAGPQVGQAALSNFYALHVVFIPVISFSLAGYHFWKVRKNGGISQPLRKEGERSARLATIPHLVNAEYAVGLVLITGLTVWSMLVTAPLGPLANPLHSPNPAKAAWYFLGLQELLLHMHPLAAIGLVGAAVVALLVVPWFDKDESDIGVYFRSQVGKRAAAVSGGLGFVLAVVMVILDEYVLDIPGWLPGVPASITTGWIPLLATLGAFTLVYLAMRKSSLRANHSEALLGVFAFAFAALVALTLIGIFFRGANMALGLTL
jgi:quinol-cytochrome oxidoreductase complex cytochrome b subunit